MPFISLTDVSVDLPVYDGAHRSFRRSILSAGIGGMIFRTSRRFVGIRALDGITLHLREGDRLGLIGPNGAGKSTLLRVLAGIHEPTSGTAVIEGGTSSLLNVNSILDPEMTGYENIDQARLFLGIPTGRRAGLYRDVETLTELGTFLDLPVKTYSAGMLVRLSFALLTAQEPEILLLDEALGVGDAGFMGRAAKRIKELRHRSHILVLASHSTDDIRQMCNKAAWLDRGRIRQLGPPEEILAAYRNCAHEELAAVGPGVGAVNEGA